MQSGVSNIEIMDALAEENIESQPVWKPMHLQPIFAGSRYFPHAEGQDVAASLFESGICLPSGSNLTEGDLDRIMDCLRRAFQGGETPTTGSATRDRVRHRA